MTGNYPGVRWPTSDLDVVPLEDKPPSGDDVDEVVLANGTFHQIKIAFPAETLNGLMTGQTPDLVGKLRPEPESPQPSSSEPLPSPSIEVGASYKCLPYTYITEPAQLEKVLPDILGATTIGVDSETTGLNPRADRLCLIQLATRTIPTSFMLVRCLW
jgi:hypothetical protein